MITIYDYKIALEKTSKALTDLINDEDISEKAKIVLGELNNTIIMPVITGSKSRNLPLNERKENEKQALEYIMEFLQNVLNNMAFDYDSNADVLANRFRLCHRTIQQNIIKYFALFIKSVSRFDTDLRNESAIKWCQKVSEIDQYFPHI